MNLPHLKHPELYQGLYVFDFGDHVAVGYTAEEIHTLLTTPEHKNGRAYKIHHASPDGQLSLRGLSAVDTNLGEAMAFYRRDESQAQADFAALKHSAMRHAPPSPVHWHLASDPQMELPHFTILIYSAVYTDAISRWLQAIGFEGGDRIEGGTKVADHYARSQATRHEKLAIAPDPRFHSRPSAQVLSQVHEPIQRDLTP